MEYLILNISPENISAFNLYRKIGFELCSNQNYYSYDKLNINPERWMVKK